MMWGRNNKIEVRLSKLLLQTALDDAAAQAIRDELSRQISDQIKGTRLEGGIVTIDYGLDKSTVNVMEFPAIPETPYLTFVWVD